MNRPIATVLVVDDDMIDRMAIRRAFKTLQIHNPVVEAADGIDALARLRGWDGLRAPRPPVLVLLDLNMPRMGGLEFLQAIKADPELCSTLVFVLTTSMAPDDRARAYAQGIAGYMLKQRDGQSFLETIDTLEHYWRIIEFPDVDELETTAIP